MRQHGPGPADYEAASYPALAFSIPRATRATDEDATELAPGPGEYDPQHGGGGPLFSFPQAYLHSYGHI